MIVPEPGAVIGGLRIDAVAGRGGMGVVYKAYQLALDRTVAMKIVNPELAGDAEFRERFRREARLAASLDHPHVVPIYHAGEDDGNVYLTMRYVDGTDLASMIASRGRVDPLDAVEMIAQVADALDAAHERGLVHRDVKPANILITRPGGRWHTYLTDFGISKDGRDAGMTRSGFVVGSLSYISPEQLQGDEVDGRADQYSLACVLFQALTGEVPFPRDTTAARMYAHMSSPAPSLGEVSPRLRGPLEQVLARALAKRPADRYPTAGDFGRAARAALAPQQGSVPQQGPQQGMPQGSGPQQRPQGIVGQVPYPMTGQQGSGPQFAPPHPSGPHPSGPHPSGPQRFMGQQGDPSGPQDLRRPSGPHPTPAAGGGRRKLILAGIAAVVVAALVVAAFFVIPALTGPGDPAQLPPTGQLVGQPIGVGAGPVDVEEGGGFLWTANRDASSITRIDPARGTTMEIPIQGSPSQIVYGQGRMWVWNYSSTILPIDVVSGMPAAAYVDVGADISQIAASPTAIWATLPDRNAVTRIDLTTGAVAGTPIPTGGRPDSIDVGNGKVYVLNKVDRTIVTLDDATGAVVGSPVPVPDTVTQVSVESGHVYLGGSKGFALATLGSDGVIAPVAATDFVDPDCTCGFYGGPESVWLYDDDKGELRRMSLDLRTQLGAPLTGLGTGLADIEYTNGKMWVLNRAQNKVFAITLGAPL